MLCASDASEVNPVMRGLTKESNVYIARNKLIVRVFYSIMTTHDRMLWLQPSNSSTVFTEPFTLRVTFSKVQNFIPLKHFEQFLISNGKKKGNFTRMEPQSYDEKATCYRKKVNIMMNELCLNTTKSPFNLPTNRNKPSVQPFTFKKNQLLFKKG